MLGYEATDSLMAETPARSREWSIVFESYGVCVKLRCSDPDILKEAERTARKALVGRLEILETGDAPHLFEITSDEGGPLYLFKDGEQISFDARKQRFFKFFDSMLRITVAEHAVDSVFIHAGVVGWKGRAILLPASSFQGKTTLVGELVRAGAEYYSDEYAVLDVGGLVQSFPRDLSVRSLRGLEVLETEVPVESFGGRVGTVPIPVGAVVLTEYVEGGHWKPEVMSTGRGLLEVIPHTIPRNFNSEFALKVLNTSVSDAIILKSPRGEAAEFAFKLLSYLDNYFSEANTT